MRKIRAPYFVIIGAQKCGTTSLFRNLSAHPKVGMHQYRHAGSSNETHYFNHLYSSKDLKWYMSQFPDDRLVLGEKTPDYHFNRVAMERMLYHFPGIRMIFLVRDPVLRFASQRNMRLQIDRSKDLGVNTILNDEAKREEYLFRGCYFDHLSWLPDWARRNMLIRPVDEEYRAVKDVPEEQLKRVEGAHGLASFDQPATETYEIVCRFLGLDPEPQDTLGNYYVRKSQYALEEDERELLSGFYRESNQRLYDYLGEDLGWI